MEARGHLASPRPIAVAAQPRACKVDDAVVCAIARERHGHFTPEQKADVLATLTAGVAVGFGFTWTDVEYVEAS